MDLDLGCAGYLWGLIDFVIFFIRLKWWMSILWGAHPSVMIPSSSIFRFHPPAIILSYMYLWQSRKRGWYVKESLWIFNRPSMSRAPQINRTVKQKFMVQPIMTRWLLSIRNPNVSSVLVSNLALWIGKECEIQVRLSVWTRTELHATTFQNLEDIAHLVERSASKESMNDDDLGSKP